MGTPSLVRNPWTRVAGRASGFPKTFNSDPVGGITVGVDQPPGPSSPAEPPPPQAPRGAPDLGLLLMVLIWGLNFSFIKAGLREMSPLAFNALRFPLAALTVFFLLRRGGRLFWPRTEDWPAVLALGFIGNVLYQLLFIFGVDRTLVGNASILLATTPIWTLLLSVLTRDERPGGLVWVGIGGTVVGMAVVVFGGRQAVTLGGWTWKGDILVLAGAFTWSIYTVGSRRLIATYGSLAVTAWTLWVGCLGLFLLGIGPLSRTPLAGLSWLAWGSVLYAGVMAIGLAYVLWYRGVEHLGNARTAAFSNLTPVVAMLVAWVWLGETPSPSQILGVLVILTGLTLARLGREKEMSSPAEVGRGG